MKMFPSFVNTKTKKDALERGRVYSVASLTHLCSQPALGHFLGAPVPSGYHLHLFERANQTPSSPAARQMGQSQASHFSCASLNGVPEVPLKNPLSWGRQGGARHSFPQARPPRPHQLAPLVLRPCPQEQHLHHGRLDCYKSSLIIGRVCFTELCPGPLPTPLQGTTFPTHSLGDRGQEKAASLPWAAPGAGECRASSVPHWEGSPLPP